MTSKRGTVKVRAVILKGFGCSLKSSDMFSLWAQG